MENSPGPTHETVPRRSGQSFPALRARIHRLEDRFFPPVAGPSSNPRGVLSPWLPEWPGLLGALALGIAVAGLLELTMFAQPIPAGGDPGQWASTSYAYVGLPYPSWVIPGQYPPLLFPLLGSLVRLFGGPIGGARAYVGLVAILLGLATYFLARSLTRRRTTALAAEALVLLNPTFLQMFFWGFYPNLLGLVFLCLSLGCFARYIRSRKGRHLLLFWTCAAATFLSHTLVGTDLLAVGGIVFLLALSIKAIPREFYRSRAGIAGIGVMVGTVGGFYLGTSFLKIPHPNYFHSGAFAYVRNGISSIFDLLIHPFVRGLQVAPSDAVPLLWVLVIGLTLYAVGIRLFWKSRLTLGTIVTLGLALGPLTLAIVGWEASVVTDYARFSYFLVLPMALAVALVLDRFLTELAIRAARSPARASERRAVRPWRAGSVAVDPPITMVVLALFAVGVIVISELVTVPSLPGDESATTKVGHDAAFLGALHMIGSSGVAGSLLTVPGVAKWSRALLVRDAYFPNLAARYTFDPTHLIDEETAYFAMTSRYVATNGIVAATALGTNASAGSATFEYQAAYFGVFTPVAAIPVGNITVTVSHNGTTAAEHVDPGATVRLAPSGSSSFALMYTGPGFVLTVTAVTFSGSPEVSYLLSATADPGYSLLTLAGNVTAPSTGSARFLRGSSAGSFELTPGKFGSTLATLAQVQPTDALKSIARFNHPGTPAHAGFLVGRAAAPGVSQLAVTFYFETGGASNLVTGLAPLIVTDSVWANWSIRWILYSNSTAQEGSLANLLPNEVTYLVNEYGGRIFGTSGPWTVVLVPAASQLLGAAMSTSISPGPGESTLSASSWKG
jgi:dolichyl-phosphate-mannose-protein mannosyltransferase